MPIDFQSLVQTTSDAFHKVGGRDLVNTVASGAVDTAAGLAAEQPLVRVNRARAAAGIDYGYEKLEVYEKWRPLIFLGACAGTAASGFALWKRKKIGEAWATYLTTGGVSAAVAWFTRPDFLRPAPAPVPVATPGEPPPTSTPAMQQVLGWLDRRVQANNLNRPGWETRTWQRVARDLGFGTLKPPASTLLTRNSM